MVLVFVLPYFIIYLSGLPYWLGRVIASAILIGFISVGSFWFSLNPNSQVIAHRAKLDRSTRLKLRNKVEIALRVLGVAFGIFFNIYITFPFAVDVVDVLRKKQPVIARDRIAGNSTIFGLSFLKQSLYLVNNNDRGNDSYTLLYSFSVLKVGHEYELKTLSRSMIVLDQQELNDR